MKPSANLAEFYEAIDDSVKQLYEKQPWWSCRECPVIGKEENCCNYAMFLVTRTEWEQMKLAPFIIKNRKRLKEDAKKSIQALEKAGYDTTSWSETVRTFGDEGLKFRCPLLGENGWCEIYRDRPGICRMYGVSAQTEDTMYGCPIVRDEVNEHFKTETVQKMDLQPMVEHLSSIAEGPTKPIVAWLAEL